MDVHPGGRYRSTSDEARARDTRLSYGESMSLSGMTSLVPSHLRLYLDTADTEQWQSWLPTGLFYGVTCNPLLLHKAGVPSDPTVLSNLAQQAFQLGVKEIHLQAWGESMMDFLRIGHAIAAIDQRIVIKLPATRAGTSAAAALIREGIPVTITAVYAVHQVLLAAAIGASYVAPYLGRINDAGGDGRASVIKMQRVLQGVHSNTRILTASIRTLSDITALAAQGVNTFTFSERIAQALFSVPETEQAAMDFERAASQTVLQQTQEEPISSSVEP